MKFIDELRHQLGDNFEVLCGSSFFDATIKLAPHFQPDKLLHNRFLLDRKFLWQSGVFRKGVKADILVLSLNPRVLSNWAILVMRRVIGKKTVIWGHAWPKAGPEVKSDKVRHLMRSLASEIVVYTNQQRQELQQKMPEKQIHVAPNALYHQHEMQSDRSITASDIIFVSRMVPNKKGILLLEAFATVVDKLPENAKLVMIGDGPQRDPMMRQSKKLNIQDRVLFPGAITDRNELNPYYHNALISVSPGRVGLGLTQSLSYGVPMIIAHDELHGPEIEAAIEGNTGYFFKENSVDDLARVILKVFAVRTAILERRETLSLLCQQQYSIEAMAQTFIDLVKK
jgi:glycosyltransferase involved in cell wall biosynthesis